MRLLEDVFHLFLAILIVAVGFGAFVLIPLLIPFLLGLGAIIIAISFVFVIIKDFSKDDDDSDS